MRLLKLKNQVKLRIWHTDPWPDLTGAIVDPVTWLPVIEDRVPTQPPLLSGMRNWSRPGVSGIAVRPGR